jgi:hypothetical protein
MRGLRERVIAWGLREEGGEPIEGKVTVGGIAEAEELGREAVDRDIRVVIERHAFITLGRWTLLRVQVNETAYANDHELDECFLAMKAEPEDGSQVRSSRFSTDGGTAIPLLHLCSQRYVYDLVIPIQI